MSGLQSPQCEPTSDHTKPLSKERAQSIQLKPNAQQAHALAPAYASPTAAGANQSMQEMQPLYTSFRSARTKQPTSPIPLAEYILNNKGANALGNQKTLNKILDY